MSFVIWSNSVGVSSLLCRFSEGVYFVFSPMVRLLRMHPLNVPLFSNFFRSRCPPEAPCGATPNCEATPTCGATPTCKTTPTRPLISSVGGSRILSLDGGGIRALIQIDILCEIERLTGKRITQLFDWIIGTSSGGILALALVYRQMTLSQLRNLYFRLKEEVFSRGRVGFCYDSERLEEVLKEQLGTDMRMGDISHPK